MRKSLTLAAVLALGAILVPAAGRAQGVSRTAKTGAYTITLRVLPAESFAGPHAAMARDGGAQPNLLDGSTHPNHHLVAFIRKGGKAVESATVGISYRQLKPTAGEWTALPVVRMHVAGKSLATTHFGNNVHLAPGSYEARVIVDGSKPAMFHFMVSK